MTNEQYHRKFWAPATMATWLKCHECGKPMFRHKNTKYCFDCASYVRPRKFRTARPIQQKAMRMVAFAVKLGFLPVLDGSVGCMDCGGVAECYDHRDYMKPVDVDPVCFSCNIKRGAGLNRDYALPHGSKAA